MFAVIEVAGKQYKVEPKQKLAVDLLDMEPGKELEIDKVLVLGTDEKSEIGKPYVKKTLKAKILEHTKDKKIIVLKFISKKRHTKKQGHRQNYTIIEMADF